MPATKTQFSEYTWKIIVGIGVVAGMFVSFFSIEDAIDTRMQREFSIQSERIIAEIDNKTGSLAKFQKDDLWDRIQLLELDIMSRTLAGKPIPERMTIHLRTMKERYRTMGAPWAKQ